MTTNTLTFSKAAEPSVQQTLEAFLDDQASRLPRHSFSKYEDVIELFRNYLNGYAFENLSRAESALFARHHGAKGPNHREYCQFFGPEKIPENLGPFLNRFMIRKVMADDEFKRAAGTATKKLLEWLAHNEFISAEAALAGMEKSAEAARNVPRAERAGMILNEAAEQGHIHIVQLDEQNPREFERFTITRVEPGTVWLEGSGHTNFGAIRVPGKAARLLQEGWEITCSLRRIEGTWRIIEVGNVYPV